MITEANSADIESKQRTTDKEPAKLINQPATLEQDILDNLYYVQGKTKELATRNDWYMAVAYTVRDRLMKNWIDTLYGMMNKQVKLVGYLTAEFLMGPHLGN